jgi:hypothetical protein
VVLEESEIWIKQYIVKKVLIAHIEMSFLIKMPVKFLCDE